MVFQLILKKLIKKIIIAIDGYSSTGKSTLAKMLSKHFHYKHINTGSMYRAVTLYALRNNWVKNINNKLVFNENRILNSIDTLDLSFRLDEQQAYKMYINDEDVDDEIKLEEVSSCVSQLSKSLLIRKKIVLMQQAMGVNKGIVMEGRDIGSVVFPNAELKLFITASEEIRAARRHQELLRLGVQVSFQNIYNNLKMRDFSDSTRKNSPLIQVKDAILIDNTDLDLSAQFDLVLDIIKSKKNLF